MKTLKDENSKLKQDMCEKKILIKRLKETLNEENSKQIWQTENWQPRKHQSQQIYHKKRETDLLQIKTLKIKC